MWMLVLCLAMYVQLLILLAFAFHLVPTLVRVLGMSVRMFLLLSYRLYRVVLTPLAEVIQAWAGVDILTGIMRVGATTALSLTLGLIVIALTPLILSPITVGICILHGIVVGLIWNELEYPGHLHLGARVQ